MNNQKMPCRITDEQVHNPWELDETEIEELQDTKASHIDELVLQEIADGCKKVNLTRDHVFKYTLHIETYHTTYSDSITNFEVEGLAAFCEQFLKEYHKKGEK